MSKLNGDALAGGHHEPGGLSAGKARGRTGEERSVVALAADDDPSTMKLIERELTAEGIAVVPARSGGHALLQFGQSRPDIILLANTMPDLDGVTVMQTLKSTGVPVILLMNGTDAAERTRVLELGADDCLVKPFVVPELAARIRAVLRRVNGGYRAGL
jgi:DNA-binding response OmpR family regulator